MGHHNTTNESGSKLARFQKHAKTQEAQILKVFRDAYVKDKTSTLSPSQVFDRLWYTRTTAAAFYLLTSIRRAMSDLTREGYLIKTDDKVTSPRGRPEYLWRLVPEATIDGFQWGLFNNEKDE